MPTGLCIRAISGRIISEDGVPLRDVELFASGDGPYAFATSGTNGEFSVTVPDSGDFYLSFETDVARCRIYFGKPGSTSDWHRATPIGAADEDTTGISFIVPTVPSALCR